MTEFVSQSTIIMATETVDSHQTSTSDEETVKSSSEAVKATEQINLYAPQESVEDDREKGKADNLHTPDANATLSTSEEKAEDIQVEPAVIEVKKTDETPVIDLPVHDNIKLEKEAIPDSLTTTVAAVVVAADETQHKENPSTEPVGGEATEPTVFVSLEKSTKELDATDNVKSPPEEQSPAELIKREILEVPPPAPAPATASAQKVQEQTPEPVGLPKLEVKSSDDIVNSQEKEKPAVAVRSVIEVPEKVEIVSVPVEEVEEKKPEITDNPELSVVADSGKGPAEEQPATEFVSVEKEPNKEPEICVPEESVEPPKKEAQKVEVVPVKEPVEVVAKEIIETVEPQTEKEQPLEVPVKELEEVIAKGISEPIEVPKEKEQAIKVDPEQQSREVIETRISESVEVPKGNELLVEVPKENELLVEVHPAKEQIVIVAKETSEPIEPLRNKEQPNDVLIQKESVEVIEKEVSASFEPPKNKEQANEGLPATESGEVKEKETSDSTLGSEEVEKQEHEVIEVKDGIGELHVITKHIQDTYVEVETVNDEKTLAPGDDVSPPIEGGKIQKEEAQCSVESDKQDSVGQVAKFDPIEDSSKVLEKEQPAIEFVSVDKEPSEEPETTYVLEDSVEPHRKEAQLIEVVLVKEPVEVIAKEVIETVETPKEEEKPVVLANETSESIEPLKNKEQPDEVLFHKESVEVIAKEIIASFDPPKNKEQTNEDLEKGQPGKEFVSVGNETEEEPETTPIPDLSVEPPKKEEQSIEVLLVEQSEVIVKEIIETVEPPKEKEKPIEVHPLMEKEITEPTELPKEKEQTEVHPVQESREVIAEKISGSVEISKEKELPTEFHPAEELEVIAEETCESIEPSKNKKKPSEVLSKKELGEIIAKEISASFEPPKSKEHGDEGFPTTESGEVKEKETSDSTLGSEEVEKLEHEVIEEKDGIGELPEIRKHIQDTYVEIETVKDENALAPGNDISPPIEGGKNQEEEAEHSVESDKQDSVGQVAKSDPIEDSGKGLVKEQPAIEFFSVDKEPSEEPETTHVSELSVEPPKKEEQLIEVPPVEEQVEVITKEIIGTIESQTEKGQPFEVHPLKGSGEVMEKEITKSLELPKEKEHGSEVHPVQESKEVIAEKIGESVEVPKEKELLIEVHPVKELEVPLEKESGDVIAKEISESFVPPKNKEQADEGEKQEPEVTEVKNGIEELPERTNHVRNNYVEVETEATVKDETVKGEKSLALRDDITPPLGGGQIHTEEEQYTVESDGQDSLDQVAQPIVELAAGNFSPQDVEEKTSNENETKESSNINVVAKLSKVETTAVEKVGEENEEKIVKTDKADEDKYEKMEELTLATEEAAHRDSEVDAVVAEKSTDNQKTGKEVDLTAETKIEESIEDGKPALVEAGNAEHIEGKVKVNETTKELQESEVEVKDKETMITSVEIPNVNDKKKVPSKPSHKQSHNLLSKVKHTLVKAKKAIIGKSPSSKTLSSEARDDIKVK